MNGVLKGSDDQAANFLGVSEPYFCFGWVHIDINIFIRQVEEEGDHRMSVSMQHIGIGGADATNNKAVFYRAAIDEQILMLRIAAVMRRQAGKTRQPCFATFNIDFHCVVLELFAHNSREACKAVIQHIAIKARIFEHCLVVMFQRETNIRISHSKSEQDVFNR